MAGSVDVLGGFPAEVAGGAESRAVSTAARQVVVKDATEAAARTESLAAQATARTQAQAATPAVKTASPASVSGAASAGRAATRTVTGAVAVQAAQKAVSEASKQLAPAQAAADAQAQMPEPGKHTRAMGTGETTHQQSVPRPQQQQHQQPGVRLHEQEQPSRQEEKGEQERHMGGRPQQQQHQQQQTQRPPQAPSLLQRARAAGVGDEIEGPIEVLAVGTTRDSATKTVEGSALPTGGGNFGKRMFAASNVETARVFAARRTTNVPGSSPGVVGIALPKPTLETLKQRGLIHFEHMTDPPPELAGSPGQWVIEPDGIKAINDDGFFFLIE